MSKRYPGGFQPYHGRKSSGASAFKWIVVFLLAVLVVAVGVYFLLQEWLVYDGTGFHVVPPWTETEEPSESPVVSDSPTPVESPSPSIIVIESPEPEPPPTLRDQALETLHAVEVTPTILLSGRAAQQVQLAGGNAALVEMKRDDGTLAYVSSVEQVVNLQASGSDTAVNQALRELIDSDLYTIAQVSCFRDNLMGNTETCALKSNSGYRWKDFDGVHWCCAANETAQNYMLSICVELAQMGFDEILLTYSGYPAAGSGEMTWIRRGDEYPFGDLETVTGPFLAKVESALAPYDTRLSVLALGSELAGETASTGLNLATVLAHCDHVWVTAEEITAYENFAAAPQNPTAKLVSISTLAGGEESQWAVTSTE